VIADRTLVTRLDSVGDVLLGGPAVRALAAQGPVDLLTSSIGRSAARLLPRVEDVLTFDAPWVLRSAPPVESGTLDAVVTELASRRYARAAILTSSHQSPLPMAMLLRLAGVGEIAAVSVDHAGSLLDHRIPGDPDVHEVERALLASAALGAPAPASTDLQVLAGGLAHPIGGHLVVHPGSSAPARTLRPAVWRDAVAAAAHRGLTVTVTAGEGERELASTVAGDHADVRSFRADDLSGLADVLASADVVASGNTGPMHVAAAVGRPVVVPWAPTVPPNRWHPWGVPYVLLGDLGIECRGCRHTTCPLPSQRCLADIDGDVVAAAAQSLVRHPAEVAS
jgi:ADP-heptose:LPS heptosyltransferase